MNEVAIEDLAYILREAKKNNLPKPIVFLGAGASVSGGVPLAKQIITDIQHKFAERPNIKRLNPDDITYATLMAQLLPYERNSLLKGYIEQAKINVTHLYLAQLMHEDYIDYVLTVNFDNLMLRALALYNVFPPTYDMAILKDLTTTSFKKKSVVYLHGQHHGLWLLNTREEMDKVKELVPLILSSITDQRSWIFIGYSGEDPIFDHITKLGRFDNGLYWVCYNDNLPNESVCENLLGRSNTNAHIIKGFDSDSFILSLVSEIKAGHPAIIEKPFSALSTILENIVDIDNKEHFGGTKERLEIAQQHVELAIRQFEKGEDFNIDKGEVEKNLLIKSMINSALDGDFSLEKFKEFKEKSDRLKDKKVYAQLSKYLMDWGTELYDIGFKANELPKILTSFKKYDECLKYNPDNYFALCRYGFARAVTYKWTKDNVHIDEAIKLLNLAILKKPHLHYAYGNLGTALRIAGDVNGNEDLYLQSIENFKKAMSIEESFEIFNGLGTVYGALCLKKGNDPTYYEKSCEMFDKAIKIKPQPSIVTNLANFVVSQKVNANQLNRYLDVLSKLVLAKMDIEGDYALLNSALFACGTLALNIFKIINEQDYLDQAISYYEEALPFGGGFYNLACSYALKMDAKNAIKALESALKRKEVLPEFVEKDPDLVFLIENHEYKKLMAMYKI